MTRILLVEDSRTQAQQIAFYLEDAGLEVEIAHDAESALELLRDGAVTVELVASDIVMPGKSGYDLCRALRAHPRLTKLPVVLLTSLRDPGELLEALASGADSFVTKPVDPDELVHRVRAVLENIRLRERGDDASVSSDGTVRFQFQDRAFAAPADPGRLVNYFSAAFEDFLSAREREQQRAISEAALRDSMRLLQSTVDALPIGIALLDVSGAVLSVNAAWLRAGAVNPFCGDAHAVGASYLTTLDALEGRNGPVAAQLARGLRSVIAGERLAFTLEYPAYGDDGEFWFHVHLTRFEEAGEVRVVAAHEEVTARHRAQIELRDSNRRLETALGDLKDAQATVVAQERLRALGQMASGIAHDFNNALAPILGYSEQLLLQQKVRSDDAKLTKRLELIMTSAQDAAHVVGRLREFARPSSGGDAPTGPVHLAELVETVIELTRPRWMHESRARGITVEMRTEFDEVPEVRGDKSELREVLTNLVFNALDAMPEGGALTFLLRDRGGRVALAVRDEGVGMTPEQRERCLEPFFTTKGEHGTGLGLAMVYGIIQRHSGDFEIDSAPGEGTTCTLTLPALTAGDVTPAEESQIGEIVPLRVLVVDDEDVNLDVMTGYLEPDGHTVTVARGGAEALALYRPGAFDLVITDRAMPGMSGDQLGEELKRRDPSVPVLMVTGFGELMSASGETPAGIDRVLAKPVSREALVGALQRLVPA